MIQYDDDDDIIIYKQVLWGNIWKVLTLRDQNFLLLPFTDWIMPRLVENCERTCRIQKHLYEKISRCNFKPQ